MKKLFLLIISLAVGLPFSEVNGQNKSFVDSLVTNYETYKEPTFKSRRIKHDDVLSLTKNIKKDEKFTINKVGESILGKDINLISLGTGEIDVFLWSQMHGDESTATQAIFDIINFFNSTGFEEEKIQILNNTKLHFLPMLNPDGADRFTRRNALTIDINRDALRLQSPEAKALKGVRDSLEADFGFNLHDQSTYYNPEGSSKPATISFLAPAFNFEKDINKVRKKAMQVIVSMNRNLQYLAPGQVGRYNDEFEPRAFGDNLQKWGTSTILIESGGYQNDVEKQEIRKLNFVSIVSALLSIANKDYEAIEITEYETIPNNDRKLFDLKITSATYEVEGIDYVLDVGINHTEEGFNNQTEFYNVGRIMDIGDLSTYYGYETFMADGYRIVSGKTHGKVFNTIDEITPDKAYEMLLEGYTHLRVNNLPKNKDYTDLPIQILGKDAKQRNFELNFSHNPTFLLVKNDVVDYAVVNGFLIDLKTNNNTIKNALIKD